MKRASAPQLVVTLVPAFLILATMLVVKLRLQIPFAEMTRDVTAIANINPLSGMLSNLGIILWCATAAVCFFAAANLRRIPGEESFRFLLCAALLSTYLLFDDFFQFHETLAQRFLGLDEKLVYLALGIAAATHLIFFRRVIFRTRFGLLGLALGFLGTSVVMDEVTEALALPLGDWEYFFEDGAKWLGIVCWFSYYIHTSHRLLGLAVARPDQAAQTEVEAVGPGLPAEMPSATS